MSTETRVTSFSPQLNTFRAFAASYDEIAYGDFGVKFGLMEMEAECDKYRERPSAARPEAEQK
jgi:hypothetical protein